MNIFRATIDHLDQLAGLYDQYRRFYEQKPDLEACRNFLFERIRNNESVIFVAQQGHGEAVGFTQLYSSYCSVEMEKLIYLYDLFVAPQARRQGVARALMDAARQYAVSCGAGRLQLETAVTNHPGRKLYESLGWERDDEFYTYHLAL